MTSHGLGEDSMDSVVLSDKVFKRADQYDVLT
jgi:hypothetical protein